MTSTLRAALSKARRGTPGDPARLTGATLAALDRGIANATNLPDAQPEATRRMILQGCATLVELNGALAVARIR